MSSTITKQEKQEALVKLRELLPPGSTVYTVLRHVSRSGMQRRISCYTLHDYGKGTEIVWLDGLIHRACGIRIYRGWQDALVVNGCGMDMGFHIVYELGYTLWGKEWPCTGQGCPSNVHNNGDLDYTPGRLHGDGGYALRHRWI